jgi:phospholipase/lecithinase/hemolysin
MVGGAVKHQATLPERPGAFSDFSSWIEEFAPMFTTSCRRQRPKRVSLHVERLEDRTLLHSAFLGKLVNFGDSLTDTGNILFGTHGAIPQSPPYFAGRFSNGPIWAEALAASLGEPALKPSLLGGLDYAFGGATAAGHGPGIRSLIPNLRQQVAAYLAVHRAASKPKDLFTFWAGSNDLFYSVDQSGVPVQPNIPTRAEANAIQTLITAKPGGARQFLVVDLPPMGQIPLFQQELHTGQISQSKVDQINAWSSTFNALLARDLRRLRTRYGVTILEISVSKYFQPVLQDPGRFGYTNVSDAATVTDANGMATAVKPGVNPDQYLFWDAIHPTTRTQQLLGVEIAAAVRSALGGHHHRGRRQSA